MHPIFIIVKDAFTWTVSRRPVSHAAAAAIVATSAYAVHHGAEASLPQLAGAATAALVGFEWLQWTALGRLATIEDARDDNRAMVLKAMCAGIGGLQIAGYTFAVLAIARESGVNWAHGWALAGVVVMAIVYAGLNFVAKYASCDPVESKRRPIPTGGTPKSLPVDALPAAFTADDGDGFERRLRLVGSLDNRDVAHATAGGQRLTDEAVHRTRKRLQKRIERSRAAA